MYPLHDQWSIIYSVYYYFHCIELEKSCKTEVIDTLNLVGHIATHRYVFFCFLKGGNCLIPLKKAGPTEIV